MRTPTTTRDTGRDETSSAATQRGSRATNVQRRSSPSAPVPSITARATGLLVAIGTAVLGGILFWNAVTSDAATIDVVIRTLAGLLLIVLGMAVGALSLAPDAIRRRLNRTR